MSNDRTVLQPAQPRYAINEIAYSRISATKGFVEPFKIAEVEFDPAAKQFRYVFRRDPLVGRNLFKGKSNEFLPITLLESELVSFCEALVIQIGVLQREAAAMRAQLETICMTSDTTDVQPDAPDPVYDKQLKVVPQPRFGIREVVYLRETAETVGRLEAFRIDNLKWDNEINEWLYFFNIRPRPRMNTTVGDREDLRRSSVLIYPESQICAICEALPLAVKFLELAQTRAQLRLDAICGTG